MNLPYCRARTIVLIIIFIPEKAMIKMEKKGERKKENEKGKEEKEKEESIKIIG